MQIAKDLRHHVRALGLTTHAAARALGVSDTTLRRFLAGGNLTMAKLEQIELGLLAIEQSRSIDDRVSLGQSIGPVTAPAAGSHR